MQVRDELIRLGEYRGVKTVALYGGQAMSKQLTALGRRAHLVVATPGRLMDHMERGTVRLDRLKAAVLDEADQMLDIGFAPDIAYILRRTPRSRQTLLFSATMPGPIRSLAYRYLRNPDWIRVGGEAEPVKEVRQVYYEVAERDRDRLLHSLLRDPKGITQALVFRRTKVGVDWLERNLRRSGLDAQAIHGDMTQAQRNAVMKRFRAKDLRILVATNVASRGPRHSRRLTRHQLRHARQSGGVRSPHRTHRPHGQDGDGFAFRFRVGLRRIGDDSVPRGRPAEGGYDGACGTKRALAGGDFPGAVVPGILAGVVGRLVYRTPGGAGNASVGWAPRADGKG